MPVFESDVVSLGGAGGTPAVARFAVPLQVLLIALAAACGDVRRDSEDSPDSAVTTREGRCGDGVADEGEECDEGAANADDAACTSECTAAACGDGLLWAGEEACDDGNRSGGDGCGPQCTLPTEIDLAVAADATFTQALDGDRISAVDGAGDVDGDGYDDLIFGSRLRSQGDPGNGAAYVVFGPGGSRDLSSADAKLVAEADSSNTGASVAGVGDVDGDGYADLLVGAWSDGQVASVGGAAYLVRGPILGIWNLSNADAKLFGDSVGAMAGSRVAGAGDLVGGPDLDLLVGAGGVQAYAGAVYVVDGSTRGAFALSDAPTTYLGEAEYDGAGADVAGRGDVDGDGLADLLVGASANAEGGVGAGAAYLVYGPPAVGAVSLASADTKLVGEPGGNAGASLAFAGDVDADGYDDILVGAPTYAVGSSPLQGAAYLVYGPPPARLDLAAADAKLVGHERNDFAGISVAGPGDLDGDGSDDLLVGAIGDGEGVYFPESAGAAFLLFGPVEGEHPLADADIKFSGADDDQVGWEVAGAGDVDADGIPDLILSSEERLHAYLVLGASL